MKLVDANEVKGELLDWATVMCEILKNHVDKMVDQLPQVNKADLRKVVLCENCVHYKRNGKCDSYFKEASRQIAPDFFCQGGENR